MAKPVLTEAQRSLLLRVPLFVPVVLTTDDSKEVAVLLRVDDLARYRKARLPLRCKFTTWQNMFGTWVACLALRVADRRENLLEVATHFNPRSAADWELVQKLATQRWLPVVFFDPDVTDSVTKRTSWAPAQRQDMWRAIEQMAKDLVGKRRDVSFDPSFDLAKIAFQHRFSMRDIFG